MCEGGKSHGDGVVVVVVGLLKQEFKAAHKNAGTPPTEAEFNRCRDVIEARLTAKRKMAFRIVPFRHTGCEW